MPAAFTAYYRVSTQQQGRSGLGLEAQQEQVRRYVASVGGTLLAEHVEIESGKVNARPVLAATIAECRRDKSVLIIAKLDRLARNVAFVSGLMEARVEFLALDAPFANRLFIHILAAVAEHERELISQRTKSALKAAKARGIVLGRHGAVLAVQNKAAASDFAEQLRQPVEKWIAEGADTLLKLASRLNEGKRGLKAAAQAA
jgi:DNA invertase Pin-like site-specific DNA recombinase